MVQDEQAGVCGLWRRAILGFEDQLYLQMAMSAHILVVAFSEAYAGVLA